MSNDKIADITQHLVNIATKGEQKKIGVEDLLKKWAVGEVDALQVINILAQNGALHELQVAAIANVFGIKHELVDPPKQEADIVDFDLGKLQKLLVEQGYTLWDGIGNPENVLPDDEVSVYCLDGTTNVNPAKTYIWNWLELSEKGYRIIGYKKAVQ